MKWYIGQPIVAIKNSQCGLIKKNQEFIIRNLKKTNCLCCVILIDVGLKSEIFSEVYCDICNMDATKKTYIIWKSEELFAPLDVNISELTKILSEPLTINQ